MHMTPESNDSFIGSQQQGYLLLLSVFFKPILTVLGLLLSMLILRPAMDLVNMGFIGSMVTIQANSTTGIPSIFGFMLVYAFITFSVFMTVFALPQDMSDRVLKWISAGIGSLGEKEAMSKIEGGASAMSRESLRSAGGNVSRRHSAKLARQEDAGDQRRHDALLASNERIIAALEGRSSKGDQPVNSGTDKVVK